MCHFVVAQVFSGAFEEAMRWCACMVMQPGYCVLVHARLCSVQRILPTWGQKKCKIRRICALAPGLDLAAPALCIDWQVEGR